VLSVEIDSLCIASAESGGSGKRIKAWCAGGARAAGLSEYGAPRRREMTSPPPPSPPTQRGGFAPAQRTLDQSEYLRRKRSSANLYRICYDVEVTFALCWRTVSLS
jgi:hypothetical protein